MKRIYPFIMLIFAAFLVRAAVFHFYLSKDKRYWQVDSATYVTLAQQLASTGRFTTQDNKPNAYRVPGYPFFLMPAFKLFGEHSLPIALWVQILLASFIPLLVYFLALVLFPGRYYSAWAAASIMVFHLGYVLYAGFAMTETLFVFFFLLFLISFFRAVLRANSSQEIECNDECKKNAKTDRFYTLLALNPAAKGQAFIQFYDDLLEPDVAYSCYRRHAADSEGLEVFLAGLMLGIASLIRPVGHYVIVVSVLLLFLVGRNKFKQLGESLILLCGWFLVVGGWLIRNALLFGNLFFHTLPGGHFLYLSAARVSAVEQGISYQQARAQLRLQVQTQEAQEILKKGRQLNDYEVCKIHERLAIKEFIAAPLTSVKMWLQDIGRTMFSLYSAEILYLEAGRPEFDYFAIHRPIKNWLARYVNPATDSNLIRGIIFAEILFCIFLLVGFFLFLWCAFVDHNKRVRKVLLLVAPFFTLFIGISLSGGYARMRLPIEFLLVVLLSNALFFKKIRNL